MKYNDIWRIIGFCALLLAGQNVLSGKERIAPGAQNTVSVMAGAPKVKYSKMIFGQFIDPESKFADEDGFRKDVIEALREIKTPIVRWPGGCFVSTYHWLDGVGKERTPVYDKTWQVEDPNTFGTDEYIKWSRKVGCEPYIKRCRS